MALPSIYLDECMDPALIEPLRQRGFDVVPHAPFLRGAADDVQLTFAAQRGWMILSENKRHFRRWHRIFQQQGRPHGGIVIVPKTEISLQALRVQMLLDWIAETCPDPASRFFVWGELQRELGSGYRIRGHAYGEDAVRRALGR